MQIHDICVTYLFHHCHNCPYCVFFNKTVRKMEIQCFKNLVMRQILLLHLWIIIVNIPLNTGTLPGTSPGTLHQIKSNFNLCHEEEAPSLRLGKTFSDWWKSSVSYQLGWLNLHLLFKETGFCNRTKIHFTYYRPNLSWSGNCWTRKYGIDIKHAHNFRRW